MKRILTLVSIFFLASGIWAQDSNLAGVIFGARDPNTYSVRPDTVGSPRFKYFNYTNQYLYNWNDSTSVWAKDSTHFLTIDVKSFRSHQQYLRGFKTYRALISQGGSSDPTVTILENTIGSIVWTRTGSGVYYGTLTGAFPAVKTVVWNQSGPNSMVSYRASDNAIAVETGGLDSMLSAYFIEIDVYY